MFALFIDTEDQNKRPLYHNIITSVDSFAVTPFTIQSSDQKKQRENFYAYFSCQRIHISN
jgi:hypothetical protein